MAPSRVEAFAKYAGFATVAAEWSAIIVYYFKVPIFFDGQHPISFFATLPQTRWAFTTCYVSAAIFCWVFTRHYLAKYYTLPLKVFAASLVLFAATGIFPYNPENIVSLVIHTSMALTGGLLFLGGMLMLAKHARDNVLYGVTLTTIVLSLGLTVAFFISPKTSHFLFLFEAGSWLMLQIWMIWISLYIQSNKPVFNGSKRSSRD